MKLLITFTLSEVVQHIVDRASKGEGERTLYRVYYRERGVTQAVFETELLSEAVRYKLKFYSMLSHT